MSATSTEGTTSMVTRHRTEIQLVLVVIGMVVWGYGQRIDDPTVRYVGIGVFAIAAAMRFLKKRDAEP